MSFRNLLLPLCLACSLFTADAWAFDVPHVDYPDIAEQAATPAGFVPHGWRLEHEARGRLDADGLDDALLVLRMDDPANVVDKTGLGPDRFDTNPRMLVAALATPDGPWRRVMANHALVPRPDSPVMDDFLDYDAAAAVQIRANRTWSVNLHSWASAGTWSTREVTYTFRLEGGCMRLVGFDQMHLHRGSGEITTTSVNHLTGRAWTRQGHVQRDEDGPTQWSRVASPERICIDDIGDGFSFEPALQEPEHLSAAIQLHTNSWTPYAVEKSMGAQWCPEDPEDVRGRNNGILNRPCFGLLPPHLVDVLVAIPEEAIFLRRELRASLATQPQKYLAVPGLGARPDFLASVDVLEGIVIRSFEGPEEGDGIYLVEGPFDCIDEKPEVAREGEYVLESDYCDAAHSAVRLYKWKQSQLHDVTQDYLPEPVLSAAEQALLGKGAPMLDLRKLSYVPSMRWLGLQAHSDEAGKHDHADGPAPLPDWVPPEKRFGHVLHLGFVVWNGKEFDAWQTLDRSSWPHAHCDALRPDNWCKSGESREEVVPDLFVGKPCMKNQRGCES